MFYINYDLAKQITADRRASARAHSLTHGSDRAHPAPPARPLEAEEADVVELSFAGHCHQEKIGA